MDKILENLPKELLIKILDFLPSKDVLNVMLVCKYFNNIINDSTKLRRKFRLNLHARKIENKDWIGSRKYSRVIMRNSSKKSLEIIKNISIHLTEIRLMFGRMFLKSFKKILLRAKNLKEISIVKMDFVECEEDFEGEMPKLSLKSLNFNGNKNLFKILKNSTVKNLSIFSVQNSSEEIEIFKNFLKSQKFLEVLEFLSFDQEFSIFDDEILSQVDFRLKKLSIYNLNDFDLEFFKNFLNNHKNSLVELTLKQDSKSNNLKLIHDEILKVFSEFKLLKILNLFNFDFPNYSFKNVKNLSIEGKKINFVEICKNFGNLENLKIYSVNELKADLSELKLKNLFIENSKILSLKIPKLENFILSDLKIKKEIFNFKNFSNPKKVLNTQNLLNSEENLNFQNSSNPQTFPSIFIDNCDELENLFEFLKLPEIFFKTLQIESCEIKKSEVEFLTSLSGSKIKNLILIHCSGNFNEIEAKKLKIM